MEFSGLTKGLTKNTMRAEDGKQGGGVAYLPNADGYTVCKLVHSPCLEARGRSLT